MKFSVLSWNVEAFKAGAGRVAKVAAHIKAQNSGKGPDVFGLFEVEEVDILGLMQNEFPNYTFAITDGPQNKEILVGWRNGKFSQVAFTQKREFKAYNPALRPGALLSVRLDQTWYSILFLHNDSGTEAPDFGNRAEMVEKIWSLKGALDRTAGAGQGRLIVLGDLNTMGLLFPGRKKVDERVTEEQEIQALAAFAAKEGMQLLAKEFDETWRNDGMTSNLDHVIATTNLQFVKKGTRPGGRPFFVTVQGWNQLSGQARKSFVQNISDHSALCVDVM